MKRRPSISSHRAAGFTATKLKGLGLDEQIAAAFYGDIAITPAGKLIREIQYSWLTKSNSDPWHDVVSKRMNDLAVPSWLKAIHLGLVGLKDRFPPTDSSSADFFLDASKFLTAQLQTATRGPVAPAFYYGGRFIYFCELARRDGTTRGLKSYEMPDVETVKNAWNRKRFRPTVTEIIEHLSEVMEDPPPAKKAERIAEVMGSKLPAKKSAYGSREHFRQFWEW